MSTEQKHSPAPWSVCNNPAPDRAGDQVIRGADGWSIAYLPGTGPQTAFDATLIARAPDLLAENERLGAQNAELLSALRDMAEFFGRGEFYDHDREHPRPRFRDDDCPLCRARVLIGRVDIAIAKAEGKV